MAWTRLPTGAFTGIDWSQPGRAAGADPYLVWAESDGFAGYGGTPQWLPIAIELQPQASIRALLEASSPKWLHVPDAYTGRAAPAGLRFCTARVRPEFFRHTAPGGRLHRMVKRLELGLPAGGHAGPPGQQAHRPLAGRPAPAARPLRGKVLALIDDSLALANTSFLDARGRSRTAFFWRQDGEGQGWVPQELGYGHEFTGADVDAAMREHRHNGLVHEGGVYAALGLSTMGRPWRGGRVPFHALDTSVSHGSHVMDLAGGATCLGDRTPGPPPGFDAPPSWARFADEASRASIVAVQLDYRTVADTSGGSLNVHVLDGLMYILSRCAADAQVVANVSFGTIAGPHDGSSVLEAAIDQLVELQRGRLQVVLAAGNSYQDRTHANLALGRNKRAVLHWEVLPGDFSQSFLELWLAPGAQGVRVQVTPPGRPALPPLAFGASGMWLDGGTHPACALIYPQRVATGAHGTCALLALAPTSSDKRSVALAPSGTWKLELLNQGPGEAVIDAYVERDDVVAGAMRQARQSRLVDDAALAWAQQYDMQAFVDDPGRSTPIRRSGNFNSIATGTRTVSAGGRRIADGSWAWYSPIAPDPDPRPARPGVVKVPATSAPSDMSCSQQGVDGAGTRSGAMVRLRGTSAAAPQEARRIFNTLR